MKLNYYSGESLEKDRTEVLEELEELAKRLKKKNWIDKPKLTGKAPL